MSNLISNYSNASYHISNTNNTNIANDLYSSVVLKEQTIMQRLESIEKKLSILVPNPKLLEKYKALQDTYNHYKMLEKILLESNE